MKRTVCALVFLNDRQFEIAMAKYDRGKLYIEVKKRESYNLTQDDMLLVVHTDDGMPMGWFEVTEEYTDSYYAVGVRDIDRLWLGHIRNQGEVYMLPYMRALYLREGGEQ